MESQLSRFIKPGLAGIRGVRLLAVSFLRLVVPPQCPACTWRTERPGTLCGPCATFVSSEIEEPSCRELAIAGLPAGDVDLDGPEDVIEIVGVGPFSGSWARVVRAFKKDPHSAALEIAESLLAQRVHLSGWADSGPNARSPILVPVPMARARRRERGVNPPEVLAASLGRRLGWTVHARLLERRRYRRTLRGLGIEDRRAEISGAISLRERIPYPPPMIVLVDDVLTTGATLEACAQPLLRAGVPAVRALVLGMTPRGRLPS